MIKQQKGFTLAEVLITLSILGVVAAITVPSLINKYSEAANRTKVKKVMATYEKALSQMVIDYDIKTNSGLTTEFPTSDTTCEKTTVYFKKAQETTGCIFKTADGVWWNITDIKNPLIS